jgi:hypothetical protein
VLSIRCCYIRGKPRDKKRLPADPLLHNRERKELLTPIMAILGFLEVLATAAMFAGDGVILFLTTITKSPSEWFSPVTMDGSGSEFLAGAVTTATAWLPHTSHTTSL